MRVMILYRRKGSKGGIAKFDENEKLELVYKCPTDLIN